jgi:hypothetical protein
MPSQFNFNAYAPYLPYTQQLGEVVAGTITQLACGGPCVCQIYSAAGVLLSSIDSTKGPAWNPANTTPPGNPLFVLPTSIAFTGGAPVIKQSSPSDITVTIEA